MAFKTKLLKNYVNNLRIRTINFFFRCVWALCVYLGAHILGDLGSSDTNRIALTSKQFQIHPKYNGRSSEVPDYDIALIRLPIEVTFNGTT